MPHFTAYITEEALDGTTEPHLLDALTNAVATVYGEPFRALAAVDLIGVPARRRTLDGAPPRNAAPHVLLSLREGAYHLASLPDAPARLVTAITDAVVDVFGEEVRDRTVVTPSGVPDGRSGHGGTLA